MVDQCCINICRVSYMHCDIIVARSNSYYLAEDRPSWQKNTAFTKLFANHFFLFEDT